MKHTPRIHIPRLLALLAVLCLFAQAALAGALEAGEKEPFMSEQTASRIAREAIRLRYGIDPGAQDAGFAEEAARTEAPRHAWQLTYTAIDGPEPTASYAVSIDAETGEVYAIEGPQEDPFVADESGEVEFIGEGTLTSFPMQGEATLQFPLTALCHIQGPVYHSTPDDTATPYDQACETAMSAVRALFAPPGGLDDFIVRTQYYFLPATDSYLWRFEFLPMQPEAGGAHYLVDVLSPSGEVSGCWKQEG